MGTPLTARLYMNELGIKCLLAYVTASVDTSLLSLQLSMIPTQM